MRNKIKTQTAGRHLLRCAALLAAAGLLLLATAGCHLGNWIERGY